MGLSVALLLLHVCTNKLLALLQIALLQSHQAVLDAHQIVLAMSNCLWANIRHCLFSHCTWKLDYVVGSCWRSSCDAC